MAITQTLRALGHWDVSLREDMPASVWDTLDYFGHVVVHMGRPDPRVAGDSLLRSSRYTGVLRKKSESGMPKNIGGLDVAMWLGDPDNKSDLVESALTVSGDFQTVINAAMAGFDAVEIGTIFNDAGLFESTFQFQSRRQIVDYICQTWGGMAWRVNGDATLDAGHEGDLFVVNPEIAVIRKPKYTPSIAGSEVDMALRALNGMLQTDQDVEDLTTRVLLMAQGSNGQFASATADAPPGTHPFLDMHGNPVKLTRVVQESETDAGNAEARAQLQLNRFLGTRDALKLSTEFYDISGVARVGDYIWVYDPEMDLVDPTNEVIFRGRRMNPLKLQLTETNWPISRGMAVCYRHWNGEWTDLTDFVEWETGETSIVVGGYNRSLTEGGSGAFPITQPEANTTVPGAPTWNEPFLGGVYQSPTSGETRAEVILDWNKPNNTDSSVITDGDHYEIRYRQSTVPLYPVTWDQLEARDFTWDEWEATGATWDHPLVFPQTEWQTAYAPFDVEQFRLQELVAAMPYEAQLRAVDNGRPANIGAWSALTLFQTVNDDIPPATPAPPTIQSNPIAVLMEHRLGVAEGGDFNLDRDLAHLELHGGNEPLFIPDDTTIVGKVQANYGMMIGQIPVVRDFQVTIQTPQYYKVVAVDEAGNKSLPSQAVQATAGLITNQYIQSLVASKITSGTVTADLIVGSRIATMPSGGFPGVEMSFSGLRGYSASGFNMLHWESSTGKLMVNGSGGIEINNGRLVVRNEFNDVIVELGECSDGRHGLQVYDDNGVRVLRAGELASGPEGIEVIDDIGRLVRVDTLAFGTHAATVATAQSRNAASFGDLATPGPVTNVDVGNSGRVIVIVSATVNPISGGSGGIVGFDMVGPAGYFLGATFLRALFMTDAADGSVNVGASKAFLVEGLPQAGNYTAALKYYTVGNCEFFDRHIIMIPF